MLRVLSRVEQRRIVLINLRCHALVIIVVVIEKLLITRLVLVAVDEILQDFLLLKPSRSCNCCVRVEYGVFQILHKTVAYGATAIMAYWILTSVVIIR